MRPLLIDNTPARIDFAVTQLTPWVLTLLCTDAADQPIDFSGCQAILHVTTGPDTSWEATTANGKLALSSGSIKIQVPLADMEALPVGRLPYHLVVTTAAGDELLPFVFRGLLIVVSGDVP